MQEILKERLYNYIIDARVDLFLDLQHSGGLQDYLNGKVSSLSEHIRSLRETGEPDLYIEENCMEELTRDLRPSPYLYLSELVEQEFEQDFHRMREEGILTYELVNMLKHCQAIFERHGFSEEKEDDRFLHYEITGAVSAYLTGA